MTTTTISDEYDAHYIPDWINFLNVPKFDIDQDINKTTWDEQKILTKYDKNYIHYCVTHNNLGRTFIICMLSLLGIIVLGIVSSTITKDKEHSELQAQLLSLLFGVVLLVAFIVFIVWLGYILAFVEADDRPTDNEINNIKLILRGNSDQPSNYSGMGRLSVSQWVYIGLFIILGIVLYLCRDKIMKLINK